MAKLNANLLDLVIDKCRICLEHHGSISIFNTPRLAEDISLCTHINNNEGPLKEMNRKESKSKSHHKNRRTKSLLDIPRKNRSVSPDVVKKNILYSLNEKKIPKIILIANNFSDSAYKIKRNDLLSSQSNEDGADPKKIDTKVDSTTKLPQSPCKKKANSPVNSETKEKADFHCQKCGRNCPSRTSLFLHLRSHDSSKILHCSVCKKAFLNKSDLIKHTRTHTGEKPFVCRRCHKGFTQNSTLKAHRKLNKCPKINRKRYLKKKTEKTHDKDTLNDHPNTTPEKTP